MEYILYLVYFAKYVEDWSGYGNLNVFCHISAYALVSILNTNNRQTTITTVDISNTEYFTHYKCRIYT